jgi:16S rRNA (cytidine1402-2'-O)-methyltransferase
MNPGTLYLIPNTLGGIEINTVIPHEVLNVIYTIDEYVVENIKSACSFLKQAGIQIPLKEINFYVLNKDTDDKGIPSFLGPLLKGKNVGVISEAGCPCIADPGSKFVSLAQSRGIRVIPLTGPSSITLSLMASGLNGQSFIFHGYLPINKNARDKKLKELTGLAFSTGYTQIFIETPHRNDSLFENIINVCRNDLKMCIAVDLTLKEEFVKTKTISLWKKEKLTIGKKPAIFLLGI